MGSLCLRALYYQKALSLNPSIPRVHKNLGDVLIIKGQFREAMGHYRKALDLQPDFSEAQLGLGNIFINFGKIEKAEYHYREALRINPKNAIAETSLHQLLSLKNNTNKRK